MFARGPRSNGNEAPPRARSGLKWRPACWSTHTAYHVDTCTGAAVRKLGFVPVPGAIGCSTVDPLRSVECRAVNDWQAETEAFPSAQPDGSLFIATASRSASLCTWQCAAQRPAPSSLISLLPDSPTITSDPTWGGARTSRSARGRGHESSRRLARAVARRFAASTASTSSGLVIRLLPVTSSRLARSSR